jgi:hypothetical protein
MYISGTRKNTDAQGNATSMYDHTPAAVDRMDHLGNAALAVAVYTGVNRKHIDDAGGGVTYVGEAANGSAESSAVWRIQRITESGPDTLIEWAESTDPAKSGQFGTPDNVWDSRAGLTYG